MTTKITPPAGARAAKIFTKTLFQVKSNYDTTEGRGREYTVGWFIDRETAEKAGKGQYVMGGDCPIETVTQEVVLNERGELFLLGKHIEVTYEDPREIRARALAKLTPEERKALKISG